MSERVRYVQIAGDALIPLLGYYLWDWNLYFILLFYIADLLVGEAFTWIRAEKLRKYDRENTKDSKWGFRLISLGTLVATVLLINVGTSFSHPSLNHLEELRAFWNYEELGISQGYILLPVLILVGYQQYQVEFLATGRFRTLTMHQLWLEHATQRVFLLAVAAISCGVLYFVAVPDQLVLWLLVTGAALYALWVNRVVR